MQQSKNVVDGSVRKVERQRTVAEFGFSLNAASDDIDTDAEKNAIHRQGFGARKRKPHSGQRAAEADRSTKIVYDGD